MARFFCLLAAMSMDFPAFPADDLSLLAREVAAARGGAFQERAWNIHGVGLRVAADHEISLRCAERLMGVFPGWGAAPASVRLWLTSGGRWSLPAAAEVLPPSSHEVIDPREEYGVDPRFARLGRINYYRFPPLGGAAYDLEAGLGVGYLVSPETRRPWLLEHLVLQMLFLEMLRGRDLFWLHSACVSHGGKAVLLVGKSGSGKTTACLNLALNGFGFLVEDRVFIRRDQTRPVLLAYPRDMAVTAQTLALLPALRDRVGETRFRSRKLRLTAAALFPGRPPDAAEPGLILFPRVTGEVRTSFRALTPAAALCRILPNSLLASHPAVSARHFQALSALAGDSRAYEVGLGRDVEALPDLVLRRLEGKAGP